MSIKFYKTILLVIFCLSFISPIKLQAYCQFEGCGDSSKLDEAPLTIQEAQGVKEFYTSVERDLSENLEVLQDGTYQVRFSEKTNVLMAIGATPLGIADVLFGYDQYGRPLGHSGLEVRDWGKDYVEQKRWESNNKILKDFLLKDVPHHIEETNTKMIIEITDPKGKYIIRIERRKNLFVFRDADTQNQFISRYHKHAEEADEINKVFFFRKSGGRWIRAKKIETFDLPLNLEFSITGDRDTILKYNKGIRDVDTMIKSLRSGRRGVWKRYLRARNIRWSSGILRAGRFVGRWTFRAVLGVAGIVGSQMLFEHAQENHPEETALVIAITKEQWEILSTNVRGIIEELSENVLNELEL